MKTIFLRALPAALLGLGLLAGAAPALAGVVVVVGAKSPAARLDAEQVSQLFTGKAAVLPGAGQAMLVDQAEGTPVRDAFYAKVTGKTPQQVKALWSRLVFSGAAQQPRAAANGAEVKKLLADNPNAIGYIDSGDIDASVKEVFRAD